jgi:ABC-2 type transport system permease protein
MAIFLRTRSDVRDIVVPRYVVSFVASVVGFVIGMTIAYVLTGLLLGWLDAVAVAIGSALFGLYLAFAVAVVALVASLVRSVPAVAMLSAGVLVVLALAGLVPQIAPYMPSELVGAADWLIRGGEFDFWRAVVTTVGLTLAMLAISIRRLETREL